MLGDEFRAEAELQIALRNAGLRTRFGRLKDRASAAAEADLVTLLSSPGFVASRTLLTAAISDLEGQARLDRATVRKVAERYTEPGLGEGIAHFEAVHPELGGNGGVIQTLAGSGAVPELDRLGRRLNQADLSAFADQLAEAAKSGRVEAIGELVRSKAEEIGL